MIRYLSHSEIDKQRWDDCIDRSVNALVYAKAWYLDLVCSNWDALVEDDYQSVCPLPFRSQYLIHYIYQPFFTQQLGVFTHSLLTPDLVTRFLTAIPEKFKMIDLQVNALNKVDDQVFRSEKRINLELNLIESFENLEKKFDQNTRRNCKKAAKSDLKIVRGVEPDQLITLFQKNFGAKDETLTFNDYDRLRTLITHCTTHNKGVILGVTLPDGTLCASVFFLTSHNRFIFHFAASNGAARETGAMFLLVESFIREHAGTPVSLDFEGSNDPNVARFYKGFGAQEVNYTRVIMNRLPFLLQMAYSIRRRLRSARNSLHL